MIDYVKVFGFTQLFCCVELIPINEETGVENGKKSIRNNASGFLWRAVDRKTA